MANQIANAALPYPIRNTRFTIQVPFVNGSGTPTDPTTPDTEVSRDGAAFADAAEEITTISGSNGMGYVTLTGSELDASAVSLAFKVASGPQPTLATLYPRVLASIGTGILTAGGSGNGTLGTPLGYDVTGCFFKTTGGTGGGGTGGANNEARRLTTYNTANGQFTVAPPFSTVLDTTTTYDILLPEGVTLGMLKALNPATAGRTLIVAASGQADANLVSSLGSSITNEDGTISSATSTTITFPTYDSSNSQILNNGQYAFREFPIIAGTGRSQVVKTTTATGTSGQYNVLAGTMVTQLDNTSKYIVGPGWSTNLTHMSGTPVTGRDIGASVVVGSNSDKTGYTLTSAAASGIAPWVWDEFLSLHTAEGTAGVALRRASGNAGGGGGLDAAATRAALGLASANLDTQLGVISASGTAIRAKTDQLTFTTANRVDSTTQAGVSTLDAAAVRTAVGLGSANLDTQLGVISASGTAIKAKTDQMTFTLAGLQDVNLSAVNANPSGLAGFSRAVMGIALGTVTTGATTTSIPTSSLTPAASVADQFKGRIMVFDRNTATAALRSQATDITANTSGGTFTVTALTTAPSAGDIFSVQ